nr:hypothetical protein [Tanacetum cinerariifolium]
YPISARFSKSSVSGKELIPSSSFSLRFLLIDDSEIVLGLPSTVARIFVPSFVVSILAVDQNCRMVYNFSKMIFDDMVRNVNNMGSKILMYPRKLFTTLKVNSLSFSGRTVPLFATMLVTQGEGSGTSTEPHHTPSPQAQQSLHHDLSSSLHPTETIPTETPTEIPTLRQYSIRATRIVQSEALPTVADEPASLLRDNSQGKAFLNVSGLEAGQDRENIIKTYALPHDSTPRVTSLDADEGNLEISNLKARIKLLEDKDKGTAELSGDDAPIKGRSLVTMEEVGVERSTEQGSNDTEEMVNVLTYMDAANILTSEVADVSVPPAVEVSTVGVPTGSGLVPTVSAIFTTASVATPYSRRLREISAKQKR